MSLMTLLLMVVITQVDICGHLPGQLSRLTPGSESRHPRPVTIGLASASGSPETGQQSNNCLNPNHISVIIRLRPGEEASAPLIHTN